MAKRKKQREWLSPIEIQLRNALVGQAAHVESHNLTIFDYSTSIRQAVCITDGGRATGIEDHEDWGVDGYNEYGVGPEAWKLYGAVLIATYKADLVLALDEGDTLVAIECDGHEWHDRTKQQASSDRARDRELLRLGVSTLRFTGSDIHHNATACAVEIIQTARLLRDRSYAVGNQNGFSDGFHAAEFSLGKKQEIADQRRRNWGVFAGIIAEAG